MIAENVDIYSLVPTQITELIDKLTNALSIIKERKQTVSKVAEYEKEKIICPYCQSNNAVKNGHRKQDHVQIYKCKGCKVEFNALTGTVFKYSHLTYEQLEIFAQCFIDKISLRKTAQRMKVDKNTAHFLRLKVLDALKDIRENTKLTGQVEGDEIYKNINLKGTKTQSMPRFSKTRQSKGTTTKGISKHKVCIVSAIDGYDSLFLEIAGTGPVTSDMMKECLAPKVRKLDCLITDCKSSYESVAKNNGWNLIQVKSNGYTDENGNSLANINSIHSGLSTFLSRFRGVSTKHLQGYLDWYAFDKMMSYKIDDNKASMEIIIKNIVTMSSDISYKSMNNNFSGIDFVDVYSDYL